MKVRSFNFIANLATVGILLGATGLQAHQKHFSSSCEARFGKHCFSHHVVEEKKDKVTSDLHVIFGSLSTVFAVEGTTDNPNPLTNEQLAGTIASERVKMNSNIEDYLQVLRSLGVKAGKLALISAANGEWVDTALAYALSVNLANTGDASQTQQVQDTLAAAFVAAGTAWGTLLANEANDPKILKSIQAVTVNSTKLVQAYRGVLDGGNTWGADPADPESQGVAATAINTANHSLAKKIGALLVYGVNHENCGR